MIVALASPSVASSLDEGLDKVKWLLSEASAQGAKIVCFRDKTVDAVKPAEIDLSDAQLVIAHHYAFDTWGDLVQLTEVLRNDEGVARFEAAVEAVVSGELDRLRSMLREHPELARARSTRGHRATLLHYVAANGVEGVRQKTICYAFMQAVGIVNDHTVDCFRYEAVGHVDEV